jgi:phosphatidylserine synthase
MNDSTAKSRNVTKELGVEGAVKPAIAIVTTSSKQRNGCIFWLFFAAAGAQFLAFLDLEVSSSRRKCLTTTPMPAWHGLVAVAVFQFLQ